MKFPLKIVFAAGSLMTNLPPGPFERKWAARPESHAALHFSHDGA